MRMFASTHLRLVSVVIFVIYIYCITEQPEVHPSKWEEKLNVGRICMYAWNACGETLVHRILSFYGGRAMQQYCNELLHFTLYRVFCNRLIVITTNMQWTMVYCFIWLSQQTGALQEAFALSKPTAIVNIRANENALTQWLISENKEGCCVI